MMKWTPHSIMVVRLLVQLVGLKKRLQRMPNGIQINQLHVSHPSVSGITNKRDREQQEGGARGEKRLLPHCERWLASGAAVATARRLTTVNSTVDAHRRSHHGHQHHRGDHGWMNSWRATLTEFLVRGYHHATPRHSTPRPRRAAPCRTPRAEP